MNSVADGRGALDRLRAALDAHGWEAVLRVLGEDWSALYQDHPKELLEALRALPEATLSQEPRLRLGMRHVQRNLSGKRENRAYDDILGTADSDKPIDKLAALTGQIAAARAAGRHADAVVIAARAVTYLRALPVETVPTLANALPEFHYHWGLTFAQDGRLSDALDQFAQSLDWAQSINHRMMVTAAGGAAALIHAIHGRGQAANAQLSTIPTVHEHEWWSTFAPVPGALAHAMLCLDRLEYAEASEVLSRIDITQAMEYWPIYYLIRTLIVVAARAGAQTELSEFETFVESLTIEHRDAALNAESAKIIRYLLLLDLHQPHRAVRQLELEPPNAQAAILNQLAATLLARRLISLHRPRQARKLIAPLLNVPGSSPRILIRALLLTAETDELNMSENLLRRAVELAQWHEHYSGFTSASESIREQVADLLGEENASIAERLRTLPQHLPVPGADALTQKESQVIEHALEGLTRPEIAQRLNVSPNTIKTQLRSAYAKLQISSRSQLAQLFETNG